MAQGLRLRLSGAGSSRDHYAPPAADIRVMVGVYACERMAEYDGNLRYNRLIDHEFKVVASYEGMTITDFSSDFLHLEAPCEISGVFQQ